MQQRPVSSTLTGRFLTEGTILSTVHALSRPRRPLL